MSVDNTATDTVAGAEGADDNVDLLGTGADTAAGGEAEKPAADAGEDDDLLEGKVGKDGEEEKPAAEGDAPVYEFKIPEGFEADAELADLSKPVFAEMKLTAEQAQGVVEKLGPQILTKIGERQAAQWKTIQKDWAKEAKADPDFGGKNLETSLSHVAKARDYLGPEFTAAVKLVGANNHPAILKALAKIGTALGEDTPGFGKPVKAASTAEQRLYPNDQPKT